MNFRIFFVSLAALPVFAFAQNRWEAESKDTLHLRGGFLSPSLTVALEPSSKASEQNRVNYAPSPVTQNFLAFGYRNVGASLIFSNKQSELDQLRYGKNTSIDFQVNFFGEKMMQQYFYQQYQGYYITNTGSVDPSLPGNTYIQRPDINTNRYGANFIYSFRPDKYSLGVVYNQNGWQVESGGSWLASAALQNHRFTNSHRLLPATVASQYGELATLQKGDLIRATGGFGGGYNWVFADRWFIGAQAILSYGLVYQNFETEEAYYKEWTGGVGGISFLAVGYNGDKHVFVVRATNDNSNYELPDLKMSITSMQTSVYYGYRFDGVDIPVLNTVSGWLD